MTQSDDEVDEPEEGEEVVELQPGEVAGQAVVGEEALPLGVVRRQVVVLHESLNWTVKK